MKKITRAEAIQLAKEALLKAEKERKTFAEKDADSLSDFDYSPMEKEIIRLTAKLEIYKELVSNREDRISQLNMEKHELLNLLKKCYLADFHESNCPTGDGCDCIQKDITKAIKKHKELSPEEL